MSALKRLPDGNWVNPADVTCIILESSVDNQRQWTKLWVRKDGGTGSLQYEGDQRGLLAGIVNAGEGEFE